MKKNYSFCLLFAFFPLFLFAQEKGIGLNLDISHQYKLISKNSGLQYSKYHVPDGYRIRPILYGYKTYRNGTRMSEFGLPFGYNYSRGVQRDSIFVNYDAQTKKFNYKLYDANYKQFGLGINYTYSFRMASVFDEKLNFWLGIKTFLAFNSVSYIPTSTIGFERKAITYLVRVEAIPSVSYKINDRFALDARWNQLVSMVMGLSYLHDKDPILMGSSGKRYTPIFDLGLIGWQPNFQIGAKYIFSTKEENNKKNKAAHKKKK